MTIETVSVFWQSKTAPELRGQGNPTEFRTAKAWVDRANTENPDIDHWVSNSSFSFEHASKVRLYPEARND